MLDIEPSPVPLDRDVFNKHYDGLLATGQLNPDILPLMDEHQIRAINELKKAIARAKRREIGFIPEDKYTQNAQ